MGAKLTKGRSVQVDVPFGGRSVRVKMFGGRSVGGRSVKAPETGEVTIGTGEAGTKEMGTGAKEVRTGTGEGEEVNTGEEVGTGEEVEGTKVGYSREEV